MNILKNINIGMYSIIKSLLISELILY